MWDPSGMKRRILQKQLARLPAPVKEKLLASMKAAENNFKAQQQRLAQARYQQKLSHMLKAQFEAMVKQSEMLEQKLREMLGEDEAVIAEKLKDEQPLNRWLAAQVAGRKRLHFEDQLIGLLSDPVPEVRQAARAALMRLSRGNDFGPMPNATSQQVTQSVQAWRWWLGQQDPPERIPEYLPLPQYAEGDDSPGLAFEPLPPPQLAEADDARP
jgi:hypothetical protein